MLIIALELEFDTPINGFEKVKSLLPNNVDFTLQ